MPGKLLQKPSPTEAGSRPGEQELLEALRRKDPAGMRAFYDRYVGYLTAVALRYVPDRSAVKDILQEAFLRMFDAAGRFEYRGEGSLRSWASRIVVNGALKSLRGKGRLQYVEDLPDMADDDDDVPAASVPPAVLQRMIQELPDGYRTVFNLFVFEKKPHREIAALLGIKEDSSASQFFRARALLARQIKAYIKEHA